MLKMRGNRWSVESGSIYRALHRLQRDRLVQETGRNGIPNRQRIEYGLTPSGELVLQSWLERAPDIEELEEITDPIRTRSYFLSLMSPSRRLHVLKSWSTENKHFVEALREEVRALEEAKDPTVIPLRSLLMQCEARHDWLRKVAEVTRAEMAGSSPDGKARKSPTTVSPV